VWGGITIWRIQCTTCQAVFTILPHFILRYRQMRPEVARDTLMATHGGLSLELCAVIGHISPMALYRVVCAFGHQSLVTVLTRCRLPWPDVGSLSSCWPLAIHNPTWRRRSASSGPSFASGRGAFWPGASMAWRTPLAAVPRACFPPEVAIHVVRLACERPDTLGRSLSQWDCAELARQLMAAELVEDISVATVRRILASHQLKPWRHHLWLYPKHPRDSAFYATVSELIDLYTRPLRDDEMVLSFDEKTRFPRI
jgi:hypothetical protein